MDCDDDDDDDEAIREIPCVQLAEIYQSTKRTT